MRRNIAALFGAAALAFTAVSPTAVLAAETAESTSPEGVEEDASEAFSEEDSEENSEEESGEGSAPEIPDVPVNIMALKGPTAMGMVWMMDQTDSGSLDAPWDFTIVSAVDEVPPALVKKEADIAAVPANLASVIYNNTDGAVQVLAVNTLGVIYIVDRDGSIENVSDLAGRTIYASGKGATPEYALDYILAGNGLDPESDVTIEWKSEHAECLAALLADESAVAMLPQPFVTTAQMKNDSIRVALDLTAEWDNLQEDGADASSMITGVVVARRAFAEEHPEAVDAFLEAYRASVDFVNANTDEAAALVGGYDIVPEAVAKQALPACNIVCITGDELKEKLSGYLSVLCEQNPAAVGGALPGEDFYYPAAIDSEEESAEAESAEETVEAESAEAPESEAQTEEAGTAA